MREAIDVADEFLEQFTDELLDLQDPETVARLRTALVILLNSDRTSTD